MKWFGKCTAVAILAAVTACSSGGGGSSTPSVKPTKPPASQPSPVLVVGDGVGRLWAYQIGTPGPPAAKPGQYDVPNSGMAGAGGILATLGDGSINVVSPQTFLGSGAVFGFEIPFTPNGVGSTSSIAVDSEANIYAVNNFSVEVFKNAIGTTEPFAAVAVQGASSGYLATLAVAPHGRLAVGIGARDSSFENSQVEFFAPIGAGAAPVGELSSVLGSYPFAYDAAGRLFASDGFALGAFAPGAHGDAAPIATQSYTSGAATLAVDALDNVYVVSKRDNSSNPELISAYAFNGLTFTPAWTILAPAASVRWLAVVE